MNDKKWVSKLEFIRKLFRKEYLIIGHSQSSYYYLDKNHQLIIEPIACFETGKVSRAIPKFLLVTEDYSVQEVEAIDYVTQRFFNYMEKRNFSL
jgi:hypothetical protein